MDPASTSMLAGLIDMVGERLPQLWSQTGRHLMLTGVATSIAVLVGLPLGILATRLRTLRGGMLGAVGILQTIPSLAMLALLLVVTGKSGVVPAIIALTFYALLPIMRNTVTGLESVPDSVNEAARGVGMTPRQQLLRVELPLALPVIMAGVRTAAVIGVGIATLSTYIGAGGLGDFIQRGLAMWDTRLILMGTIPAAALALLVDFAIWVVEWVLRPSRGWQRTLFGRTVRRAAWVVPASLVVFVLAAALTQPFERADVPEGDAAVAETWRTGEPGRITVASKEFAEQLILGEIMAQLLEERTHLEVRRQLGLGGTMICHEGLVAGEIDLYAEYTGTGYRQVLDLEEIVGPYSTFAAVSRRYAQQEGAPWSAEWLEPFGFNNTYAIVVREDQAAQRGWRTLSDLAADAAELRAGFTSEFQERDDGYPGLQEVYGLRFDSATDMDTALMFDALEGGQIDVISAFATDGRLAAPAFRVLEDDRQFFPPYDAAPVVRTEVLEAHPEIRRVLALLSGLLDDDTMRRLNNEVQTDRRPPEEAARQFLIDYGLIPTPDGS